MEESDKNWSEAVEDLVASGDVDSAIILLEDAVRELEENCEASTNLLVPALEELAKLYTLKNFSLKADTLISRATLLKLRANHISSPSSGSKETIKYPSIRSELVDPGASTNSGEDKANQSVEETHKSDEDEDDWETLADSVSCKLNLSESLSSVSTAPENASYLVPSQRRGRGTFSYKRDELYSEKVHDLNLDHKGEEPDDDGVEIRHNGYLNHKCSTQHVLVLHDFPPSTKTMDLERLFVDFQNRGYSIKWVDDTTALAVFRSPSTAREAHMSIVFPFKTRILDENDPLISRISVKDLETPRMRPQTSARTAQRLIAQAIGMKISDPNFGPKERRAAEEARRSRILTRQKLIEEAWGSE